jgi:signal transduction histidine kinase/ligand-binding sensor domain-containing protein
MPHFSRIWLIAVWFLVASSSAQAEFDYAQPYFERVGDVDSINGGVVTAMARTPSGMLWLGTQNGLLRYDGYRFKSYRLDLNNPNSIAGDFISAVKVARDGRIWIGTQNDGVSVLTPASGRIQNYRRSEESQPSEAHQISSQISSNGIRTLCETDEGMWIGTQSGLNLFHAEKFTQFLIPADQKNAADINFIRSLTLDRAGNLWIGSTSGLRVRRAHTQGDTALEAIASGAEANSFAGQGISSILQLRDGSLMIGTRQNGLARIVNPLSAAPLLSRVQPNTSDSTLALATNRVQAMIQPNDHDVWLASATGGIGVLDLVTLQIKQRWVHDQNVVGSLAFDAIGALEMDPTGLIWVGTWGGGLQKIQANNFAFRTLRVANANSTTSGLSMSDVHSVLELRDKTLLIGTGGNGIDVFDRQQGRMDAFRPAIGANADRNALSDGVVIAMKQSASGAVWVGTQSGGLFHLDLAARKFTHVGPAGAVSDLMLAKDGTLWIGSSKGVARVREPACFDDNYQPELVLDTENKPVLGQINPLAQDLEGRIWAGSSDGLRVLMPGASQFQIVRHDETRSDSLVHNAVYGLLVDKLGALWVATQQGVDRMVPGALMAGTLTDEVLPGGTLPSGGRENLNAVRFTHVSADLAKLDRDKFGDSARGLDVGANLLQDGLGRIWTDQVVIDMAQQTMTPLSRADGVDIGTTWTGAYTQTADGLFLSGGTTGVLLVDPSQFSPWALAPDVQATELRINGIAQELSDLSPGTAFGLTLAPEQRSFSIEFAALDFSAPQNNRYRYRLVGFDRDWIATDANQRSASYSNLWPRQYVLEVRGSNRSGAWSPKILRIPIAVMPAFWQTRWFVLIAALLAAALIAAILRWRTRHLQQRSVVLNALVLARTGELQHANSQLMDTNQELEQAQQRLIEAQKQLILQEKMASLGQLVAGVAHEVNTPIGIALTASSFLQQRSGEFGRAVAAASLTKSDLSQFASDAAQSSALVAQHLDRAANLVRQFKQVSVDRSFDQRRVVMLDALMIEIIDSLAHLCKHRAITLAYSGAPKVALDTYAGAIGQVLSTLVQNALQHAFAPEQAGTLSISLRELPMPERTSAKDRVQAAHQQNQQTALSRSHDSRASDGPVRIELVVTDDGVGMDATTCGKIFEPFFTTIRNQGGVGLGLHIVFNLVTQRLGGSIEVESTPGGGSRFIVIFPARV